MNGESKLNEIMVDEDKNIKPINLFYIPRYDNNNKNNTSKI